MKRIVIFVIYSVLFIYRFMIKIENFMYIYRDKREKSRESVVSAGPFC